jgi:hypothetical protein
MDAEGRVADRCSFGDSVVDVLICETAIGLFVLELNIRLPAHLKPLPQFEIRHEFAIPKQVGAALSVWPASRRTDRARLSSQACQAGRRAPDSPQLTRLVTDHSGCSWKSNRIDAEPIAD